MTRRLVLSLGALILLGTFAAAQQPESAPATRGHLGDITFYKDDVWYLIGNVHVFFGDLEIRCETAVVWMIKNEPGAESRMKQPGPPGRVFAAAGGGRAKEVYAEGIVRIHQKDEVHLCESAFFDFIHERGLIVDPDSRYPFTTPKGQKATLHLKADELRMLSEVQFELKGARVSTCTYGNPHYHVASETVELFRARASGNPPPGAESRPGEPTPSYYYTASGNTLYAGSGFPVLWLPDFAGDSGSPAGRTVRYIKDVRFGSSSQFGTQVGITLGDELRSQDGKKWGSYLVDLDYRSKRGPGVGVDFAYEQQSFKGELKTAYQHDVGEDRIYGKPPTEERWRLSWRNRAYYENHVQLDLELNAFSDEGFYPTYFKGEFKNDKPPETYAYLKRAVGSSAFTGLFSARINDWETVTEYRPKLDYTLITEPITNVFDNPLYLTARTEIAQPRHQFDDDLHLPNVDTLRVDLDTLVEYPFLAGPVKFTPFAGLRTTYYEYDLARNHDQERTGFTFGGEVSMQLARDYGCRGGFFDLDGLRHVVVPSIEYRQTTGVNLHPEELFQYDPVDSYDNEETVKFEVRNTFQTVRHRKGKPISVDEVFDLDLAMIWYPNPDRDNDGDPWSNLVGNGVLRISDPLQFVTQFEWNPNDRDLEVLDFAVGYAPSEKIQTYAGIHHFDHAYDVVYGQASWRVTEKWLLRAYASYDFHRGQWDQHDFVISRIGHDWVFSAIVRADFNTDEFSFSIGMEPRLLFDAVLEPRGLRREPEFQYLGTRIVR